MILVEQVCIVQNIWFSKHYNNLLINLGIGFGEYNSGLTIPNPLGLYLINLMIAADIARENQCKDIFHWRKCSFFRGLRFKLNDNSHFFFEIDPTDFDSDIDFEGKEDYKRINFGLTHNFKDFNLRAYYANNNKFFFKLPILLMAKVLTRILKILMKAYQEK